jgi:hypothetical protein
MTLTAVVVLLALIASTASKADPYATLIAYENSQRLTAQLAGRESHRLPFRLADVPQHFIQAPQSDESISVEVVVQWIGNNSVLQNPGFDLTQKVRLVIEE